MQRGSQFRLLQCGFIQNIGTESDATALEQPQHTGAASRRQSIDLVIGRLAGPTELGSCVGVFRVLRLEKDAIEDKPTALAWRARRLRSPSVAAAGACRFAA